MNAQRLRWQPAYIGVGSNLDEPRDQVRQAILELKELPDCVVTAVSALYQSAPMGPQDQPDFINAAVAMLTHMTPHQLLDALQIIEDDHGRRRDGQHWGPRTIDLDLLVFGGMRISDKVLTVPHPGIRERNFVLLPLCELAPQLIVPGVGTVTALTDAVLSSGDRIEKIIEESA
jgi:2-amino-4-hydroxy-6-hydroxymethyldihydropteridine diphosphokinase